RLDPLWPDHGRAADRIADRRPALRRGPRLARRPRLRDDPARAAPAALRHMSSADQLALTLTDVPDEAQKAVISEGLGAYNDAVGGTGDYRPLAVLVSDPEIGTVGGGLCGGSYRGQLFIDRFFVPESLRGNDLGSRALA